MKSKVKEILDEISEYDGLNVAFITSSNDLKTVEESIEEWAKMNNINLFVISNEDLYRFHGLYYDDISPTYELPEDVYEAITKPNTVIFIKDAHTMDDTNDRRRVIDLVCDNYKIPFKGGFKYLDNLLFTIMTYDRSNKTPQEFRDLFTYDAKDSFGLVCLDAHLDN